MEREKVNPLVFPHVVRFFVPGIPIGEPRARATAFTPKGGAKAKARVYKPTTGKAADWREAIAMIASRVHPPFGNARFEGPVIASLDFFFERPSSCKGQAWRCSKPDVDNLEKLIFDVLTTSGRFWKDDAQVAAVRTRKLYVVPDPERIPGIVYASEPGVTVELCGRLVSAETLPILKPPTNRFLRAKVRG